MIACHDKLGTSMYTVNIILVPKTAVTYFILKVNSKYHCSSCVNKHSNSRPFASMNIIIIIILLCQEYVYFGTLDIKHCAEVDMASKATKMVINSILPIYMTS